MTERRYRVWLGVIVALATAVYGSTLGAKFTFDDVQSILGHVGVHGPFSLQNIFLRDFWGLPFSHTIGTWRPVATLTFFIDWHLGSGAPWMFHLTNLVVHAGLLLAASAFLRRFAGDELGPRARLVTLAAFSALVIHVDVVPSATGRAEMLAALFVLLAAVVLMPKERSPGWGAIAASGGLLGLALLSKESALPMALAGPYIAVRRAHAAGRLHAKKAVGAFAVSLAVLGAVIAFRMGKLPFVKATGFQVLPDNYLHALSWGQQKLAACEVFTHYLEHTLTGLDLVPDYSYSALSVTTSGLGIRTVLGLCAYVALGVVFVRGFRRLPRASDAVVGFMGAFLVASHLVMPASAMVADRLFFFPSFWLVLLVALLVARIPDAKAADDEERRTLGPRRLVVIAVVGLTAAQGLIAAAAATNWHDDATLLTQAIQTRPHVARTRTNFAMVLHTAKRYEDSAWNVLLAHAYFTHFPSPVPESSYPLAWDDLPFPERMGELRAALGAPKYAAVLRRARLSSLEWRLPESSRVIASWVGTLPPESEEGQPSETPRAPAPAPGLSAPE